MVKEMDDDAKLAKIGRNGGPSSSRSSRVVTILIGARATAIKTRTTALQNGGFNNRGKGGKNNKGHQQGKEQQWTSTRERTKKTSPFFKQPVQGAKTGMLILFPLSLPRFFQLCLPFGLRLTVV
jgi:hypothetical protein